MPDWLFPLLGGIGVFVLTQFGILIWTLARMNTTLAFIRSDLERAVKDFEKREEKRDGEMATMWKRIDELRMSH